MITADDDPPASPAARRYRAALEELHQRSWELELLVSGAVLFGLFQAIPWADGLFWRASLTLGGDLWVTFFIGYEYTKLLLYSLTAAFLVHLATRAWWVGLIGLDSVFPRGPRWDALPYGPATIEVYKELPRIRRLIVKADALASVLFSFGFAIAFIFLMSVLLTGGIAAIAWLLALAIPPWSFGGAVKVLLVLFMALVLLAPGLDRLAGTRILAMRRGGPVLRSLLRFVGRITMARLYAPVTLVLFSNVPRRRAYGVFLASLFGLIGLFLVRDVMIARDRLSIDSFAHFPDRPGTFGMDPRYYEAYRDPAHWHLPSIPSEVVRGPYVRLFVPLSPERVEAGVAEVCPDLPTVKTPGLAFGDDDPPPTEETLLALRDCLALLAPTTLDGVALTAEAFVLGVHPTSGARGLVAYLPTANLAPGSHLIVVERPPLPDEDRPTRRFPIRFWR